MSMSFGSEGPEMRVIDFVEDATAGVDPIRDAQQALRLQQRFSLNAAHRL
jgi:hypothetical protein